MLTPSRSAALGALLSLVVLSACSTPVRINGVEVDGKVPFLAVLEQVWREERADDKHAQLASETGCWLLREPKTGTLQPRAFCGPIRHLEDLGKPGVWDELEFEPRLIDDKQVTVDPDDVDPGDTGLEVPEGLELYRPDGKQPVPADQVPTPPLPKAPTGQIIKDESGSVKGWTEPEGAVIKAPGFTLTLNRVATPETLPADGDRRWPMAPAEGQEFIAFTVTRQNDPDFVRGRAGTSTTYSLRVGGQIFPLEQTLGYDRGVFAISEDPVTLVASIPAGAEADLVVGVEGVDQTISLRTGKRTSTTAAAYYRDTTPSGGNQQYRSRPYRNGDFQLQHGITFTEASVSPFDRDRGWAPPGQMWFYLDWDHGYSQRAGKRKHVYDQPAYDSGASIKLADQTGAAIKIIEGNPVTDIHQDEEGRIVTHVPDTTKSIKVVYAPQGDFHVSSSYTDQPVVPQTGRFDFEIMEFAVDL